MSAFEFFVSTILPPPSGNDHCVSLVSVIIIGNPTDMASRVDIEKGSSVLEIGHYVQLFSEHLFKSEI